MVKQRRSSYRIKRQTERGTELLDINNAATGNELDHKGDPITYSITGGNNNDLFSINQHGIISFTKDKQYQRELDSVHPLTIQGASKNHNNPSIIEAVIVFKKRQKLSCDDKSRANSLKSDQWIGSRCSDSLEGDTDANVLRGKQGDDRIKPKAGDDLVKANPGEDTVRGGRGDDTCGGGQGSDHLRGNQGQDLLRGKRDDDQLRGGQGGDTLRGGSGDDDLSGNNGNDHLNGKRDNDKLNGGDGDDSLIGGTGADRFVLSTGNDTITDFDPEQGDQLVIDPDLTLSFQQDGNHLLLLDDANSIQTTLLNTTLDQLLIAHPDLA